MAVSYKLASGSPIGAPPLDVTADTTQRLPVGTRVKGVDTSTGAYGEAEFEYVKFTGTVVAADFVLYDDKAKTCVKLPSSATKGNVGISVAAQADTYYGYVMVKGTHDAANVATASLTNPTALTGSGTAGRATTGTSSYLLEGVFARGDSASNLGPVTILYPVSAGR